MTDNKNPFPGVKFSYLRDPNRPERVLTIARRLVKVGEVMTVEFAYSLNRPPTVRHYYVNHQLVNTYENSDGDKFDKNIARKIAYGRLLNDHSFSLPVMENNHPYDKVLEFLSNSDQVCKLVNRIAENEQHFQLFVRRANKLAAVVAEWSADAVAE